MQRLAPLVIVSILSVMLLDSPRLCGVARAQPVVAGKKEAPADTRKKEASPAGPADNSQNTTLEPPPTWAIGVGALLVVGVGLLLWRAARGPSQPFILKLGPSFFFWLGLGYLALLLLIAGVYSRDFTRILLAGILPLGVPWFGALGAVTISLEGVFLWNAQWSNKYNYWHIGRPLFGAVLGIVAFFIFFLIVSASGTTPKFLQSNPPQPSDVIVFYVVAFLVGYREEAFRELIKRAMDMILKPGTPSTTPAVIFKRQIQGQDQVIFSVDFGEVAPGPQPVTIMIQNTGTEPLVEPQVSATTTHPEGGNAFRIDNNQLAGLRNLAPGDSRPVDVILTAEANATYTGRLTVLGKNLPTGQMITLSGRGKARQ